MTTEIATGVIAPPESQGPLPGVAAVATGSAPITNTKRIKWEKEDLQAAIRKRDWWAVQCSAKRIAELAEKLERGDEDPRWPNVEMNHSPKPYTLNQPDAAK